VGEWVSDKALLLRYEITECVGKRLESKGDNFYTLRLETLSLTLSTLSLTHSLTHSHPLRPLRPLHYPLLTTPTTHYPLLTHYSLTHSLTHSPTCIMTILLPLIFLLHLHLTPSLPHSLTHSPHSPPPAPPPLQHHLPPTHSLTHAAALHYPIVRWYHFPKTGGTSLRLRLHRFCRLARHNLTAHYGLSDECGLPFACHQG
jgi:hypothetical protein